MVLSSFKKRCREVAIKVTDSTVRVTCSNGFLGVLREEVWQNLAGNVVKYNIAFINHHLSPGDNGRVLGYDSAHGKHERHFKGCVEEIGFERYDLLLGRFLAEVKALRDEKA